MTFFSKSVLSWGEYIDYDLDGYESEPILEGGYSMPIKRKLNVLRRKSQALYLIKLYN